MIKSIVTDVIKGVVVSVMVFTLSIIVIAIIGYFVLNAVLPDVIMDKLNEVLFN